MNTFEGVSESTIQTYNTEIRQVVIFVMTITDSVELFSLVFHICTYQNKQTNKQKKKKTTNTCLDQLYYLLLIRHELGQVKIIKIVYSVFFFSNTRLVQGHFHYLRMHTAYCIY